MRRQCYSSCGRSAKARSHFCSDACGRSYADELVLGNGVRWCSVCEEWGDENQMQSNDVLCCGHKGRGVDVHGLSLKGSS